MQMNNETLVVEIQKINEARQLRGVRPVPPELGERYKNVRYALSQGFQATSAASDFDTIISKLSIIDAELRGFAYEGVGSALAQRDIQNPSQQSLVEIFSTQYAGDYDNFVYVGAGLMLGRQRLPIKKYLELLNPAKSYLVIDGYAFQYALLSWQETLEKQIIPEELSGYDCTVFDQGMGRGIWFLDAADVNRISKTIDAFPIERQVNLWCGIGYACCFAGGADLETLKALGTAAGSHKSVLAQSVALAAKSRYQLGHSSVYAERACEVLCGISFEEAAHLVETIVEHPPENEDWQHYRMGLMRSSKALLTV